ncbi:hypothetical protein FACS1894204_13250 [Synergistales bacterium]|nr:hypothetical protein FACS1894204_13250 [Synergistales bacterium]
MGGADVGLLSLRLVGVCGQNKIGIVGVGQTACDVLDLCDLNEALKTGDILDHLSDADLIILVGGTEEKMFPVVLDAAKNSGALVISTRDVSSPSMNECLPGIIKALVSIAGSDDPNCIDMADLQTFLEDYGLTAFGTGQGFGVDKMTDAAKQALDYPMMAGKVGAKKILLEITAGKNASMKELHNVYSLVRTVMDEDVMTICGCRCDPKMGSLNSACVIIMAGGGVVDGQEQSLEPLCRIV